MGGVDVGALLFEIQQIEAVMHNREGLQLSAEAAGQKTRHNRAFAVQSDRILHFYPQGRDSQITGQV